MNIRNKIILLIIIVILLIPIVINEINLRPKLKLISDVEKILDNIEGYDSQENILEVLIVDEYKIDNKTYKVKGNGVIFLEDNPSVMLSRNGMCAMKLPYSDEIMFQEEECPKYRLINGEKVITK